MFMCTCNPLTFTFNVDIIYLLNAIKRFYTQLPFGHHLYHPVSTYYMFFFRLYYIGAYRLNVSVYHRPFWDISEVQTKSEYEWRATHFYFAFNSSPHQREDQFLAGLLKCVKNYIGTRSLCVHCTFSKSRRLKRSEMCL